MRSASPATDVVTFGTVLRRGLAAGAAAGAASAVVLWTVTEPLIDQAIEIEDQRTAGGGGQLAHVPAHAHGGELVTRTQQFWVGGVTFLLFGILVGLVVAVVFARMRHRLPGSRDFARSLVVAGVGFTALALAPAIAIPANPPAVGDTQTVSERSTIWAVTVLSVIAVALALPMLDRWLAGRGLADATRWSIDIAAVAVAGVLLLLALPATPDTVPPDMPASLLWDFRVASLGQHGALWLTLGTVFGLLMERAAKEPAAAAEASAAGAPAAGGPAVGGPAPVEA